MKDISKSAVTRLNRVDIRSTPLGSIELPEFDDLVKMAEKDPAGLEHLRQKITQEVISGAPKHMRERLSGLQFQVDMQRKRQDNPVSTCVTLSSMMNESLGELRQALTEPDKYLESKTASKAAILKFPGK